MAFQSFLAISQICPKLDLQVEGYAKEFLRFQVHKLCGSRDIYIQKCVFSYFYLLNILLASDVVCIWPLINQSQSATVILKGKLVCLLMTIDRV